MIFNYKIETKLGLRYYGGGMSSGGGKNSSQSTGQSVAQSVSGSAAQYTPQELLEMYSTALPSILSTATNAVRTSPTAASLDAANRGAVEGVNAINLTGLTPGEANAVERSTNQNLFSTGNLGVNNGTNTIANAMNFGGAFNSKLGMLNNATNTAAGVSNAGSGALGTVANAFQPFAQNASTQNSASGSFMNSQNQSTSKGSTSSAGTQVSLCYLTTACCSHKGLPDDCEELTVLRSFRDSFVPKVVVRAYYALADELVPKIQNNQQELEYIYNQIKQCVKDIKVGNKFAAYNRYTKMVKHLEAI